MMKTALLIFVLLAVQPLTAAEDTSMPPLKAIEQFGEILISDGSSYYIFSKDGSFRSGPLGLSGRAFEGRWTSNGLTFTAIAKLGWMNGISSDQDYRRIVFVIYHVQKRQPVTKPTKWSQLTLFDSYFVIDEMVKIPKPAEVHSK
jgi:hypothetical protein